LRFKKSINKDKTKNMNNLEAYKMDGLGNDFVIFDKRETPISLSKEQIIKISDRNNIGCDQVIFIDKDKSSNAFLKFYNSDGGEISACGNGSRCVAYLLMKENNNKKISLRTKVGILQAELNDKNLVNINMGQPSFEWNKIPLLKKRITKI
jgi:diaminopimelate epimerase